MIKLYNLLATEPEMPNLLEIYLYHKKLDENVIDIKVDNFIINNIYEKYKNFKTTKFISYNRNELSYLYDLTDDNQYVYSKIMKNTFNDKNIYIVSSIISKLPTHLFPCLNDIDDIIEYTISECKISNRISIIIKKDSFGQYVYIEYKHSHQVDIDKIESSINHIIRNVSS
jgi:hypothetical protein